MYFVYQSFRNSLKPPPLCHSRRGLLMLNRVMWRNSARFSSKLISSLNPKSNSFNHHGIGNPFYLPRVFSATASTVGSAKSVPLGSLGSVELTPSALSDLSASKVRDAAGLVKHYGRCYYELSKACLSVVVVVTSGAGYWLGSGSAVDYAGLCYTCAGTMMVAAAANSFNQVYEVDFDARMKRTMNRPLPSGRISKAHAATWASCAGIAGTTLLACKANMLTAGLAAFNLALYVKIYTPLKQIHPVNTWVGAIVGAIPPLLGWTAAAGAVSLNAMILPAALYFWQIPHFMALAYMYRQDYVDGGFKMFSLTDASGRRTAMVALRNCLYLLPLGYLAYDWGITSVWFCLESTILVLAFAGTALSFYFDRSTNSARTMFRASIPYLIVFIFGAGFHCVRVPGNEVQGLVVNEFAAEFRVEETDRPQYNKQGLLVEETDRPQYNKLKQGRPPVAFAPVAFASAAPFPFLPAPDMS